eukprot:11404-Heterococcus_DN1.PRE.4
MHYCTANTTPESESQQHSSSSYKTVLTATLATHCTVYMHTHTILHVQVTCTHTKECNVRITCSGWLHTSNSACSSVIR